MSELTGAFCLGFLFGIALMGIVGIAVMGDDEEEK